MAEWTSAYINDLPDSSFLYVEEGDKDEEGRTTPRSKRHLPYRDAEGKVDLPHLRNAISRLGQSDTGESGGESWLTDDLRERLLSKARGILEKESGGDSEGDEDGKALPEDMVVAWGGAVKALGNGRVQGWLVRFTDEDTPDLEGEYFSKATDFDFVDGERTAIYYHHGGDETLGPRKIGDGALRMMDAGVWIDGQLALRDEYEKMLYERGIEPGRMGFSSGTAPHLVERVPSEGKATWLKRWPLRMDASITPTPAEPSTRVLTLKAYMAQAQAALPDLGPQGAVEQTASARVEKTATPKPQKSKAPDGGGGDNVDRFKIGPQWYVYHTDENGQRTGDPVKAFESAEDADTYIADLKKPDWQRAVEELTKANQKQMTEALTKVMAAGEGDAEAKALAGKVQVKGREPVFADFIKALVNRDAKALAEMGAEPAQARKGADGKVVGEQSAAAGAVLVPTQFIPDLFQLQPEAEIAYPRADRISCDGPIVLPGISTAGSTAGQANYWGGMWWSWTEAGEEKTETEPSFTEVELHPWELSGYTEVRDQLLRRSAINVNQLLTGMFQSGLAFMRDEAFLDGTGAGQPQGIITAPGTYVQPRQVANNITFLDLVRMKMHLLPSSWMNAMWIFHISTYEELRTIQDPNNQYMWPPETAVTGEPPRFLGLPYVFTEKTAMLGEQGDVCLADWSYYYAADEQNVAIAVSEHYKFRDNRTAFKVFLTIDGQEKLDEPLYLKDGTTQVSPFVVLDDATT